MTLNRVSLEEYLDGELAPGQIALVEQELRVNAGAANLLERMRRERALRGAALATFMPRPGEVTAMVQRLEGKFDEASAPVAKIGGGRQWLIRSAAVAAMLVIAAGAFWAGRATTGGGNGVPVASVPYVVHVVSSDGVVTTHEFPSLAEAKTFAQTIADKAMAQEQVASADGPGVF